MEPIEALELEEDDLEAEIHEMDRRADEITAVLSWDEVREDPFKAGTLGWTMENRSLSLTSRALKAAIR